MTSNDDQVNMDVNATDGKKLPRRKRVLSSFQVFSRFVAQDEKGAKNGEAVLSAECFQLWLSTRDVPPMHPQESFRRTLTAHIRGKDGRKPFDDDVEWSLLKLLRDTGTHEAQYSAWDRCFENNNAKIGKRGFKKLGFHEQRRRDAGLENDLLQRSQQMMSTNAKRALTMEQNLDRAAKKKRKDIPGMASADGVNGVQLLPQQNNSLSLGRGQVPTGAPILSTNFPTLFQLNSGFAGSGFNNGGGLKANTGTDVNMLAQLLASDGSAGFNILPSSLLQNGNQFCSNSQILKVDPESEAKRLQDQRAQADKAKRETVNNTTPANFVNFVQQLQKAGIPNPLSSSNTTNNIPGVSFNGQVNGKMNNNNNGNPAILQSQNSSLQGIMDSLTKFYTQQSSPGNIANNNNLATSHNVHKNTNPTSNSNNNPAINTNVTSTTTTTNNCSNNTVDLKQSAGIKTDSATASLGNTYQTNNLTGRLPQNHILPPPHERHFNKNKTIGRQLMSNKSTIPETARTMLQRGLPDAQVAAGMSSVLELLFTAKSLFPALVENGEVWIRWRVYRADGKVGLYLVQLKSLDRDNELASFQDQSDMFPELLSLPMFV